LKKLVLAAVALAALSLTASVSASSAKSAAPAPLVFRYLDVTKTFKAAFPENRAPRQGDMAWFHDDIYTWRGAKRGVRVGHVDATITFLSRSLARISAVAAIPGGTITVFGDSGEKRVTTYAILGGTGAYATARGEVTVRDLGGEDSDTSAITIRVWK
jgi:hypothetical protein